MTRAPAVLRMEGGVTGGTVCGVSRSFGSTWARRRRAVVYPLVGVVVLAAGLGLLLPAARADASVPVGTPAGYSVAGIDVSSYNGPVDWGVVKADGVSFAYVRASEQAGTPDASFLANYLAAKAHGLVVGAYHRAKPDASSGKAQADYFLAHAQFSNDGKTLPPVVDMEWPRAGWTGPHGEPLSSCYNMTPARVVAWTRAFLAEIATRTGRLGAVYTSTSWWNLCTNSDTTFAQNPLWVARYSSNPLPLPAGWPGFTFWQYTNAGRLSNGQIVDQDVFSGDAAALAALAQGTPTALSSWVDAKYQHVVHLSADDHVRELYARLSGTRWAGNDLTTLARAPAAFPESGLSSWVDAKYQHVAYVTADGHVRELYFRLSGGSWAQNDLTRLAGAPPAVPGSALTSWMDAKYQHIAYVSTNGHVHELYFRLSGGRWAENDLTTLARAPAAYPESELSSWVDAKYQHVAYVTADGHVRELYFRLSGGSWAQNDLTRLAGAPPAVPASALTSWVDAKYQHITYVSTDGHVHEFYFRLSGGSWVDNDLTTAARTSSPLLDTALSSWVTSTAQHVVYLSTDNHVRELYFRFAGGGWRETDLTTAAHAPLALLGSALSSWVKAAYQHVGYFAVDGHVHELRFHSSGTSWSQTDIHTSAGGA
jgi:GH25 family lysozyme M1 (1,4-beta-N-acetylmuramidase)